MNRSALQTTFALLAFIYMQACTQATTETAGGSGGGINASCSSTVAEIELCTTPQTLTGSVVTGTTYFSKRTINVGSNLTLGSPIATPLPIKFAEVRVLNAAGTLVQCGETDAAGNLTAIGGGTLRIPNSAGSYTVQVLARTTKTFNMGGGKPSFTINSAVKKEICNNEVHKLTKTVTSDGTTAINISSSDLTATANENINSEVPGGAFNILNDLITTTSYLASNTSSSDLTCLNNKLHIYWSAGFNPGQYIDTTSDPSTVDNISFYLRGQSSLFINGGKLGNVATEDTDHFDDAVIIHEIGHAIEDACGKMDSPGGSHNGLFRIDPRLAWSEGWGNFLGAHIIKNNLSSINPEIAGAMPNGWTYYLDTIGYDATNSNLASNQLIKFSLDKAGNNPEINSLGYYYDRVFPAVNPGEGHFREVSIARSLFKTTNSCTATNLCTNTNYMPQIWRAFENKSSGIGMGKSNYHFRNSALFYNRLNAVFGSMPASVDQTLNTDEAQQRDISSDYVSGGFKLWPAYGIKLIKNGSTPCPLKIEPKQESQTTTYYNPDQRFSNHFYWIDPATISGVTQITLNLSYVSGTSGLNFALALFEDGYTFSNATSSSQYLKFSGFLGVSSPKTITGLSGLTPGSAYLLNIKTNTTGLTINSSTQYSYTLTDQSGGYLCPDTSY